VEQALQLIILVNILLVALSGCVEEGTGTLILQITDAPPELDISQALVAITHIEVHLLGKGWMRIIDDLQTFDLIELQDITAQLGTAELSAGHYTQIRLYVDTALVTIDGVEYRLKIPSDKIHLIYPFQIKANHTTTLTLDYDIQESVHQTGNGKYLMRPVVKIIRE
jgi:hypothetical protein